MPPIGEPPARGPASGAAPRRDFYFDDFAIGETHVTPSWIATEEEIVAFAAKYDPQYFHLDRERAKASVFGELVAGGFQTAALSWALVLRTGMFDECAVAGIGIDELRWLKPLRAGDVVRVEFTLVEGTPSRSRPGIARAIFAYAMKNQRDEPILTLRIIQLLKMRPRDA